MIKTLQYFVDFTLMHMIVYLSKAYTKFKKLDMRPKGIIHQNSEHQKPVKSEFKYS